MIFRSDFWYKGYSSFFLFLLLFSACTIPLSKTLPPDHPPRLGIIGFKMTAPIHSLSSIEETPQTVSFPEESTLVSQALRKVEDKATEFLVDDLIRTNMLEPVVIPEGLFGTQRGTKPTLSQLNLMREKSGVDAALYGEIPWYGKTRLIYPILGESLDITAESAAIGLATHWNVALISANIGLELLTSTPLWFGGAYIFGWAFRPVTVEVWILSTADGKEIWHKSIDRITSRKILKSYPESERSKKEVQLEASLRNAIDDLAEALNE